MLPQIKASKVEAAFGQFITATRGVFAAEPDPAKRWLKLNPFLRELLDNPAFRDHSRKWPDCVPTDRAENLLFYEDPDYSFVVNGLVKAPNRGYNRIHDHAHIYTLYGLVEGHETIPRYERLDDGSVPGYAKVRQTAELHTGPGDVDLVKPWEIHTEINGDERSVAVIVRSEKQGGFLQGRYDPVTNKYFQGLGPRQTPYQIR